MVRRHQRSLAAPEHGAYARDRKPALDACATTNNGVTAVIDPYGRVRQSIPRHQVDALPAEYGFRDDVTFYTAHGDVFAWLCAILSSGVAGWSVLKRRKLVSVKGTGKTSRRG